MITGELTASCGGCDRRLTVRVAEHPRAAANITLLYALAAAARDSDPLGPWRLRDIYTKVTYCPHCWRAIMLGVTGDDHDDGWSRPRGILDPVPWAAPLRGRPRDVLAYLEFFTHADGVAEPLPACRYDPRWPSPLTVHDHVSYRERELADRRRPA